MLGSGKAKPKKNWGGGGGNCFKMGKKQSWSAFA